MTQGAQELLKKALTLPDKERVDMAGSLIDSFDGTIVENADAAWLDEVARRLEEVRTGKVETISWNEVRRRGHNRVQVVSFQN
jgi:putative addiction module component (TIGR02574 family)